MARPAIHVHMRVARLSIVVGIVALRAVEPRLLARVTIGRCPRMACGASQAGMRRALVGGGVGRNGQAYSSGGDLRIARALAVAVEAKRRGTLPRNGASFVARPALGVIRRRLGQFLACRVACTALFHGTLPVDDVPGVSVRRLDDGVRVVAGNAVAELPRGLFLHAAVLALAHTSPHRIVTHPTTLGQVGPRGRLIHVARIGVRGIGGNARVAGGAGELAVRGKVESRRIN